MSDLSAPLVSAPKGPHFQSEYPTPPVTPRASLVILSDLTCPLVQMPLCLAQVLLLRDTSAKKH